jgi:hypothetical protein
MTQALWATSSWVAATAFSPRLMSRAMFLFLVWASGDTGYRFQVLLQLDLHALGSKAEVEPHVIRYHLD